MEPVTGSHAQIAERDSKDAFGFKITGGKVLHVGVNGGTNTAWYDYINNGYPDGVGEDSNLHATPKSATAWYVTSITTFCYLPDNYVKPSCTEPFSPNPGATSPGVEYSAQLQPKVEGENPPCKEQRVVMETGTGYATLHPTPGGTGDWAVVERLAWTGSTATTDPAVTIRYNDNPPYNASNPSNLRVMPLCDSDPRITPFRLPLNVSPGLPSDAAGVPHTSCILEVTVSAGDSQSSRKYVAWIYSSVDGYRGVT